ncbi:MAG: hypothetical protein V1659_03905 [Candidatus Woesearchaeota archaeon]
MIKTLTLEQVYDRCVADGFVTLKDDVDIELAKSLLSSAVSAFERSRKIEQVFEKETKDFSSFLTERYEVLRKLAEAFLLFDKVWLENHQCLFAYLSVKHPELELDWDFFESIRIKTSSVNEFGVFFGREQWNEIKFQLGLYITTLLKAVEEKIKDL